jgi:hypothetical protein
MSANDTQVGGTHYQSSFQHWDMMAEEFGSAYFKGVITKYLVRWRKKNGLEDLNKAKHYLQKLMEVLDHGVVQTPMPSTVGAGFCKSNALERGDAAATMAVLIAVDRADLDVAMKLIEKLIAEV